VCVCVFYTHVLYTFINLSVIINSPFVSWIFQEIIKISSSCRLERECRSTMLKLQKTCNNVKEIKRLLRSRGTKIFYREASDNEADFKDIVRDVEWV